MIRFELVPSGDVREPSPEEIAYDRMVARNRRFHCHCGRFVKAKTVHRAAYPINDLFRWECSQCGPCSG